MNIDNFSGMRELSDAELALIGGGELEVGPVCVLNGDVPPVIVQAVCGAAPIVQAIASGVSTLVGAL
jgi:hypothetical protein